MKSSLPSPYDYLDFRRYLGDWFTAKKKANPRFSHRMFARLAKQKSPSLLHHVIEGTRNLTPQTVEAFATALSLRAGEAQFFRLLVELDQGKTADARNAAWEQISATRRFREARHLDKSAFEYLSNWTLPAIRELATRPDFDPDPAWIADTLRPRIPVADAEKAVALLIELGLLVESEGTLVPAEASVTTPPEVERLAVRNFHRGMLNRAIESIDLFSGAERHLLGVTVGVPAAMLPQLKAESNAFLERLMHLCDSSTDDTDQILQLNLQIFPLSARREDAE